MSSHLNWMIIRDNNAFLLKKRNIKKPFSTVRNSQCFTNSINCRSIIIVIFINNLITKLLFRLMNV